MMSILQVIIALKLPKNKRPHHYKPDIVRAVGYYIDPDTGVLKPDPTYKGPRALQLIECKYATDMDMHEVINHIYTIYDPLKAGHPGPRILE